MMVVDIKPYLWIIDSPGQPLVGAIEDLAEWADLRYIEPTQPIPEWDDQPDAILFSAEIEDGSSGAIFEQLVESAGITPILIIARLRSLGQALTYFRAGAADYLSLPLDSEEVRERVEAALEKRSPDRMPTVVVELESLDAEPGETTLSIQNIRPVDPQEENQAGETPETSAAGRKIDESGEDDILAQLSGDSAAPPPDPEIIALDLFAVADSEAQDTLNGEIGAGTEIIYKASSALKSTPAPAVGHPDEDASLPRETGPAPEIRPLPAFAPAETPVAVPPIPLVVEPPIPPKPNAAAGPTPAPEPEIASADAGGVYLNEKEAEAGRDYIPEADEEEPEAVDGLPIPTLWDELPCGLLAFDSAGNLVFANALGMELLGYDNLAALQEALDNGRSSFKAYGLNHKPLPDNQWPQTMATKARTARSAVVSVERPDRRRLWLRIDCLPHLHEGKITRLSMTLVNLTGDLPPLAEPETEKAAAPQKEAKRGKREKGRAKRGK